MQRTSPPKALPKAFHEIWSALAQADQQIGSRRLLATRLGISTHTLQRLLVTGEVPALADCRNARIVRSWARILTRLARHFDREPREWIEMVGIPWDDAVQKTVAAVLRSVPGRRPRHAADSVPMAGGDVGLQPGAAATSWPRRLTVGIATYGPHPVASAAELFLSNLARRICGALMPTGRPRFLAMGELELARDITAPHGTVDLAVGLMQSVPRASTGASFVAIPGWRVRLGAVCIRRQPPKAGNLSWPAVLSDDASPGMPPPTFLVMEDDVAHAYLQGQCGLPADRLLIRDLAGGDDIDIVLRRELERRPEPPLIFLSDAETCLQVSGRLQRAEDFADRFTVQELDRFHQEGPTYPLAMALPRRHQALAEALRQAQTEELFGCSSADTARLYASLLAAELTSPGQEPAADNRRQRPAGWHLGDFAAASEDFQRNVCRHFLQLARQAIRARPREHVASDAGQRRPMAAGDLAQEYARRLLPCAWGESLTGAVLGHLLTVESGSRSLGQCQSCSVSLDDPLHRGISDRYCRFCADEHGRLKPREEVELLIASWMRSWQGDIPEELARRRARQFMKAMPAWSSN